MAEALFYALGLTALYGAGNVIARRHALVAAVHLALTLFALSGIYLLLGSPLLAGLNLLVYAGAILVLFLFVIMLLDLRRDEPLPLDLRAKVGPAAAFVLGVEVLALAFAAGGGG
ncbi:MAG: NADH-quinone oxidoreductase subunit J family protein, partial [Planctomycetota bacterium]